MAEAPAKRPVDPVKLKNTALGVIVAVWLAPFGLFYSTILGGVVMAIAWLGTIAAIIRGTRAEALADAGARVFETVGGSQWWYLLVLPYAASAVWAWIACTRHNDRLLARGGG